MTEQNVISTIESSKDLMCLLRIQEAMGKILFYAGSYGKPDVLLFTNHEKDYEASLHLMMLIGEQAFNISDNTKSAFPQINWEQLKSFRTIVANDYLRIDKHVVSTLKKSDITDLKALITAFINTQLAEGVFAKEDISKCKGSIQFQYIDFASFKLGK